MSLLTEDVTGVVLKFIRHGVMSNFVAFKGS